MPSQSILGDGGRMSRTPPTTALRGPGDRRDDTGNGWIPADDVDPNFAGIQVLGQPDKTFTFHIKSPSGSGLALVSFNEVTGAPDRFRPDHLQSGEQASARFQCPRVADGSSRRSAVVGRGGSAGIYRRHLDHAPSYTTAIGYGWITAPSGNFDRGALSGTNYSNLLRDGAYGTAPATFEADVQPGTYQVTVTMGDNAGAPGTT